jgi:AcrR family transcriptional regulator
MANTAPSDTAAYKRLLSAARKIFARKGYSGTSVREIVAAAGVTQPVLNYYFRNKEGLYLELFREPFAKLVALLDEVSNGRERGKGGCYMVSSSLEP